MDYAQRRKLQGKETERRILNAALDLMRDRGFDKVSIRDICKEAGITTGAFYHHFSSKEALLESGFAPLDDYMAGALAGHEEEPPDLRLWRILSAYAKFMEQSGELIGRYYQRRIASPWRGPSAARCSARRAPSRSSPGVTSMTWACGAARSAGCARPWRPLCWHTPRQIPGRPCWTGQMHSKRA